jgi:site-specific recombinase XerD
MVPANMNKPFEGDDEFVEYREYREYLQTAGKSRHTTRAYLQDLQAFAAWFRTSNGEEFSPRAVDPRDITEYRGYLLRKGVSSATVNRRLISLRRYFKWVHRQGLVDESPFDLLERVYVREQASREIAPRWLDSKEQLALLRAVRKGTGKGIGEGIGEGSNDGSALSNSSNASIRDMAVIQTLLGTGVRISELANLKLEDIEVSERKGLVRVREGKGGKPCTAIAMMRKLPGMDHWYQ